MKAKEEKNVLFFVCVFFRFVCNFQVIQLVFKEFLFVFFLNLRNRIILSTHKEAEEANVS